MTAPTADTDSMLPRARLIDPLTIPVPEDLRTARLRLRKPAPEMAEAMAEARFESDAALRPWFHQEMGTPAEEADPGWQAAQLATAGQAFDQRRDLGFCIFRQDRLIGAIGLNPLWRRGQVKLSYWIRSGAQRQGLGTEAVGAMTRFAFEALSARLVTTGHAAPNEGSARLARKLGFREIARQPLACELPDGTLVTGVGYALEDPRALKVAPAMHPANWQ